MDGIKLGLFVHEEVPMVNLRLPATHLIDPIGSIFAACSTQTHGEDTPGSSDKQSALNLLFALYEHESVYR